MKPLGQYRDIHSHRVEDALRGDTVVSVPPGTHMDPQGTYSVGIHPWATESRIGLAELKQLVSDARRREVVAIGECGFDRLRGGDLDTQRRLFDFHARLAEQLSKPLVIHAVRADDLLLEAAKRHRPKPGMWIIHGYRGKPEAAEALLRAGLALSFGEKYNADTMARTPSERLYRESDAEN